MNFKSVDRLDLTADCLQNNEQLPEYINSWLTDALARWQAGESLVNAIGIFDNNKERLYRRDIIICDYARTLPGKKNWRKAKFIISDVKKIDRGYRKVNAVIAAADRIQALPRSVDMIYRILESAGV